RTGDQPAAAARHATELQLREAPGGAVRGADRRTHRRHSEADRGGAGTRAGQGRAPHAADLRAGGHRRNAPAGTPRRGPPTPPTAVRPPSLSHVEGDPAVRVVESFLYADAIADEKPDLEKTVGVLKLMLR